MDDRISIRHALPSDAGALVQLIIELADYEHLRHEAQPDAEALQKHLGAKTHPRCEALVAEETASGDVVGMALFFHNYSTFLTRWGIFLEDLYVKPEYRGGGVGFALLKKLAQIAVDRGCARLEWNVLDWNESAIRFYEKLGARPMDEWTTMRLSGDALAALGTIG